jgi:NADPH:quinone reductase-like Zn-dependent oxidoreductase
MRGIQFTEFGGPEVLALVDLPDPAPEAGQIRVAVRAAGVNPADWKMRRGLWGGPLPRQTGLEVAGVVDAVGDGVRGAAVGDPVFGPALRTAGAAERALLAHWARVPEAIDFIAAAALPVAVEAATRTLDLIGIGGRPGEILLVHGASGSVGLAAVQLARARGARVIGTAGAAHQALIRQHGAQPTTYGDGLTERVRALTAGHAVDAALDAAGGDVLPALVELTGGPARVVTLADEAGAEQTGTTFTSRAGAWHGLDDVVALIEHGRFSLPVARTFALAQIADAHRLSETGHPGGKLVLTVP